MKNKISLIGVGPGDPELLTVKAKKRIQSANIIFYPITKADSKSLALETIKEYITNKTLLFPLIFPMIDSIKENTDLESIRLKNIKFIEETIIKNKALNSIIITNGDPAIYSTIMYLNWNLLNYDIEVIPGITSFSYAASILNKHLVQNNEDLLILPLSQNIEYIEKKISKNNNIILMKFHKKKAQYLKKIIKKYHLENNIIILSNLGQSNEMISFNYEDINEKLPYFTIILIKKDYLMNQNNGK